MVGASALPERPLAVVIAQLTHARRIGSKFHMNASTHLLANCVRLIVGTGGISASDCAVSLVEVCGDTEPAFFLLVRNASLLFGFVRRDSGG